MNRRAKGARTRLTVKKIYEELGYKVHTFPEGKFVADCFGVADLLVCGKGKLFLVQVKSGKVYPSKEYKQFTVDTQCPLVFCRKEDYKDPEFFVLIDGDMYTLDGPDELPDTARL